MTLLSQIVGVEKGIKAAINKQTAPLFHAAKRPELFAGLTKTYDPINDEGEQFPAESVKVQLTVDQLLEDFGVASTRLLDVLSTKENANTQAKADVVIDDKVLIKQAPVSLLLQLERYFQQEVRGLVVSLPILDPALDWSPATSERKGIQVTPEVKRAKTKKITKPLILAQATDKHPAQVQVINVDELTGYWAEKKFSGAVSAQRKQELLDRVDELINAFRYAREAANSITVTDKPIAKALFTHLFS